MDKVAFLKIAKEVNGFKYEFQMQINSPLGVAYDFCHECLMEIVELSKKSADQIKRNEETANS